MGNIQGEPSEKDSNSPSGKTVGRYPTKNKYNKGCIVIPYTWELRRECQEDMQDVWHLDPLQG